MENQLHGTYLTRHMLHNMYSLRSKIIVTFGHKLRYKIKATFREISLKLHQTNWNVARNNANVVGKLMNYQVN
jgi:hypothetical protein